MADDQKKVGVDIDVKSLGAGQIKQLSNLFADFSKVVDTSVEKIKVFQSELNKITVPTNLKQVVTEIEKLKDLKVPGMKQLASGFSQLEKIGTPPNLDKFVDEVKKFKGLSVPGVLQLANGFRILSEETVNAQLAGARLRVLFRNLRRFSEINLPNLKDVALALNSIVDPSLKMGLVGSRLRVLYRNLKSFSDVKVPTLKTFVESLYTLTESSLNIGLVSARLRVLYRNMKRFSEVKIPDLQSFTKAIQLLSEKTVDLNKVSNILTSVAQSLKVFKDTKTPGITSFVNGLNKLIQFDIGSLSSKVKLLNQEIKNLDKTGYLKNFSRFASDLSRVSQQLKIANSSFDRFNSTVEKASHSVITFGKRIQTYLQYKGIAQVTGYITQGLTSGRDAIIDYDQALKDLQAITRSTTDEVSMMSNRLLQVADESKFSASEIANGMKLLGQAGLSATESMQSIEAATNLATGTLTDMATSVDLITTAMRVFHIAASQSTRIADVFANAVNGSKLTIDKLRTALNYVGPIAYSAGIGLEELTSVLGLLANAGLRASTSGTGVRRVLAELVDPGKSFREAIARAGLSLSDFDTKSKSMREVLANMKILLSDTSVAFDLFQKRGAAAALAMTASLEEYDLMLGRIETSGTAAEMAAIQIEGLDSSIKKLIGRLKNLAVAVGHGGAIDAMKALIDIISNLTKSVTDFTNTTIGNSIVQLGVWATAIGGVTLAFGTLFAILTSPMVVGIFTSISKIGSGIVLFLQSIPALLLLNVTPAISVLSKVVIIAGLAFLKMSQHFDLFKKSSMSLVGMSEQYKTLADEVKDFRIELAAIDKTSTKYTNTTLRFRDSIIESAKSMKEISPAAQKAIDSIHPLTGEFLDGGKAVREYEDTLNALSLSKYAEALKELYGEIDKLNRKNGFSVKDSEKFIALQERAANEIDVVLKKLFDMKAIDLKTTMVEEVEELAKAFGLPAEAIDALSSRFGELKALAKEPVTLIDKWAEKANPNEISDFIPEYKKLGAVIDEVSEKQIREIELEQQSLVDQQKAIKRRRDQRLKDNEDRKVVLEDYYKELSDLEAKADVIKRKQSENIHYQNISLLQQERKDLDKHFDIIAEKHKGNDERIIQERQNAIATSAKKEAEIVAGTYTHNAEMMAEAQEKELKQREVLYNKTLHEISLQEAAGVKSHIEAEKEKTKATLDYYKDVYEYHKNLHKLTLVTGNEKEIKKRYNAMEEAQANYYQEADAFLVKQTKAERDALAKILDTLDKEAAARTKHKDKIKKLEKDLGKEREKIRKTASKKILEEERKLAEKIKDYNEKIVDEEKSVAADKTKIEKSVSDKIFDIRTSKLSEEKKALAEQERAFFELSRGRVLLSEAEKTKDKEKLDLAKDLIDSAIGRVDAIKDEDKAVKLLQASEFDLKKIREVQGAIEIDKIKEKIKEEEDETKRKIINIQKTKEEEIKALQEKNKVEMEEETKAYNLQMSNFKKAKAELSEIKDVAEEIRDIVSDTKYSNLFGSEPSVKLNESEGTERYSTGAKVRASTGLRIPGFGGGDKVHALVEKGEWIINKHAVKKYGDYFMSMLNKGRLAFSNGGSVSKALSSVAPSVTSRMSFAGLSNFGTVELISDNVKIPAIVHKDVISQLENHMNKLKRFRS